MRIAISTMIWKRHDIFHIWAMAWIRLVKSFPDIEFIIVVCGSEGHKSASLARSYGFHYIECPNSPIGRKANIRLQFTHKFNPDYVLTCGSDDIMNNKTFRFYLGKIKEGFEEIAPMGIYYWDVIGQQLAYSKGYQNHRKGEPIAPFRMAKSNILDACSWEPWWDEETGSLDGWYRDTLNDISRKKCYYSPKNEKLFILDIKDKESKNLFSWRPNWDKVNVDMLKQIPEWKLIYQL